MATGPRHCGWSLSIIRRPTAKASLAEVRSLLYVADDSGQVTASTRKQLLEQIEELGRMLGGLIRALGHRLRVKSVR